MNRRLNPNDNFGLNKPIIFYDGNCALCNKGLLFIIRHDKSGSFLYAPIQSSFAKPFFQNYKLPDSVVLYENGMVFTEAEAVFRILKHLKTKWKFLRVFRVLPLYITNRLYRFVARNRQHWFGYSSTCLLPSVDEISKLEIYSD